MKKDFKLSDLQDWDVVITNDNSIYIVNVKHGKFIGRDGFLNICDYTDDFKMIVDDEQEDDFYEEFNIKRIYRDIIISLLNDKITVKLEPFNMIWESENQEYESSFPRYGDTYYTPSPYNHECNYDIYTWYDLKRDKELLRLGLVFDKQEDAVEKANEYGWGEYND